MPIPSPGGQPGESGLDAESSRPHGAGRRGQEWPRIMYKGRKIVVVVPAHNEEAFIGGVIATMPDFVDAIVVVEELSTSLDWIC